MVDVCARCIKYLCDSSENAIVDALQLSDSCCCCGVQSLDQANADADADDDEVLLVSPVAAEVVYLLLFDLI